MPQDPETGYDIQNRGTGEFTGEVPVGYGNYDPMAPLGSSAPSQQKPKGSIDVQGLAADPQFKALSPHLKRVTFRKLLGNDPDFQALDPQRQNVVSNRVLNQFPDDTTPASLQMLPKNTGSFLGRPYKWGGETPEGWDCSGLVKYIYGQHGIRLPRTAAQQYKAGQPVEQDALQPGDAVFFRNTGGRQGITHVGVYMGDGKFMHAQGAKTGTVITPLSDPHYAARFAGARRFRTLDQEPATATVKPTDVADYRKKYFQDPANSGSIPAKMLERVMQYRPQHREQVIPPTWSLVGKQALLQEAATRDKAIRAQIISRIPSPQKPERKVLPLSPSSPVAGKSPVSFPSDSLVGKAQTEWQKDPKGWEKKIADYNKDNRFWPKPPGDNKPNDLAFRLTSLHPSEWEDELNKSGFSLVGKVAVVRRAHELLQSHLLEAPRGPIEMTFPQYPSALARLPEKGALGQVRQAGEFISGMTSYPNLAMMATIPGGGKLGRAVAALFGGQALYGAEEEARKGRYTSAFLNAILGGMMARHAMKGEGPQPILSPEGEVLTPVSRKGAIQQLEAVRKQGALEEAPRILPRRRTQEGVKPSATQEGEIPQGLGEYPRVPQRPVVPAHEAEVREGAGGQAGGGGRVEPATEVRPEVQQKVAPTWDELHDRDPRDFSLGVNVDADRVVVTVRRRGGGTNDTIPVDISEKEATFIRNHDASTEAMDSPELAGLRLRIAHVQDTHEGIEVGDTINGLTDYGQPVEGRLIEIVPAKSEQFVDPLTYQQKTANRPGYHLIETPDGKQVAMRGDIRLVGKGTKSEVQPQAPKPEAVTPAAPAKKGPVTILAAAYRMPDGKIRVGPNHPEILAKEGITGFETAESRNTPDFGFYTNTGKFVSREQAARIATKSGQNLKEFEAAEPAHSDEIAQAGTTTPISETGKPVKARKEPVSKRTGLTPSQTDYLTEGLKQAAYISEENRGAQVSIQVPDDGEFVVSSSEQAGNLHKALTGKPIPGLEFLTHDRPAETLTRFDTLLEDLKKVKTPAELETWRQRVKSEHAAKPFDDDQQRWLREAVDRKAQSVTRKETILSSMREPTEVEPARPVAPKEEKPSETLTTQPQAKEPLTAEAKPTRTARNRAFTIRKEPTAPAAEVKPSVRTEPEELAKIANIPVYGRGEDYHQALSSLAAKGIPVYERFEDVPNGEQLRYHGTYLKNIPAILEEEVKGLLSSQEDASSRRFADIVLAMRVEGKDAPTAVTDTDLVKVGKPVAAILNSPYDADLAYQKRTFARQVTEPAKPPVPLAEGETYIGRGGEEGTHIIRGASGMERQVSEPTPATPPPAAAPRPAETPPARETPEQVVDRLNLESVTSGKRRTEVIAQANAIAAKLEAGKTPTPADAPGLPRTEYSALVAALRDQRRPSTPVKPIVKENAVPTEEGQEAVGDGHEDRGTGLLTGPLDPRLIEQAVRNTAAYLKSKWTGGRYRATAQIDKGASDLLHKLVASNESAETSAMLSSRYVLEGLSKNERDLFERWLLDQRAQAIIAAGGDPTGIPPLSRGEEMLIEQSPRIQAAIMRHMGGSPLSPQPEILRRRQIASPAMPMQETPSGAFVSLIAKEKPEQIPAVPSGSVASRMRQKGTRFAKQAKGQAEAGYVQDYPTILRASFREVTDKANLKTFYKYLLQNKLAAVAKKGQPLPDTIRINGVDYPTKRVEYRFPVTSKKTGRPIVLDMAVPEPIWRDINDARLPHVTERDSVYGRIQGFATSMALLTPAELVNHTWRILNIASTVPSIGAAKVVRVFENLLPYAGPKIGALYRLYNTDMSLPENASVLQRLMDSNAGSSRAFSDYIVHRIPIVGRIQEWTHDFLFSIPEGKGLKGFDIRVRVMAEKIREAFEKNQDPQRVRDFANQFGQYTSHPDKLIEKMRWLNPFAATQLPVRLTELRQMIGASGLKALTPDQRIALRAETLWRGTVGTILTFTMLNKALTGHWPWENDKGHETDLQVGVDTDGKPIYISGTKISPTMARAMRTVGAQKAISTAHEGATKRIPADILRGMTNEAIATGVSPLASLLFMGGTGKAPYLTPGGQLLHVTPKAEDKEMQWWENIKGAGVHISPIAGRAFEPPPFSETIQNPLWRIVQQSEILFGPIMRKDKPKRKAGVSVRPTYKSPVGSGIE